MPSKHVVTATSHFKNQAPEPTCLSVLDPTFPALSKQRAGPGYNASACSARGPGMEPQQSLSQGKRSRPGSVSSPDSSHRPTSTTQLQPQCRVGSAAPQTALCSLITPLNLLCCLFGPLPGKAYPGSSEGQLWRWTAPPLLLGRVEQFTTRSPRIKGKLLPRALLLLQGHFPPWPPVFPRA